ncbi:hypothetical protein [Paenibacillus sp. FSL H7-0714]
MDNSILLISEQDGVQTSTRFSRRFYKFMDQTPKQWRKGSLSVSEA